MLTVIMKWISIAALLTLLALWRSPADTRTFIAASLICAGAATVLVQALQARRYVWAGVFFAVGTLFNPFVPVTFPPGLFASFNLVCLAMFIASLVILKREPIFSIASITDRTPGAVSL
jgi:hypothetical protein